MNAQAPPPVKRKASLPTSPTVTLSRKPLDQLEQDIVSLSQHINASEYEFLVLLREFDPRQGRKAYHVNYCAEWLNMRCGIAPTTVREKLRDVVLAASSAVARGRL